MSLFKKGSNADNLFKKAGQVASFGMKVLDHPATGMVVGALAPELLPAYGAYKSLQKNIK